VLKKRISLIYQLFVKANLLLAIVLLFMTIRVTPALPARANPVASSRAESLEGLLNPDSPLNLTASFQGTLGLDGLDVTADSTRESIVTPAACSTSSATAWYALPNLGLTPRVRDMELAGNDLYVGGRFTQTGDGTMTNLGRIARYDTSAGTWHVLSNQGLSDEVIALAVVGSDLYVGGTFTQTVDGSVVGMGNVARYNITTSTWHALPNEGLSGSVFAMAVVGSDLYVGGTFTQSGDGSLTNLNYIARYDTTNPGWHALPNDGLNGSVWTLAADGSDLYVGGGFTQPGDGSATILNHIVRYDTTTPSWHALSNLGLDDHVTALMVSGSDLYVGGRFVQTGNGAVTNLNHVARYDVTGSTWHGLSNQGLNDGVSALTMVDSILYVGGEFIQTGDGAVTNLGFIALYDTMTATWEALPDQGLNNWVYVMVVVGGRLYVVGEFSQTGDGTVSGLNHIARFDMVGNQVYLPLVLRP